MDVIKRLALVIVLGLVAVWLLGPPFRDAMVDVGEKFRRARALQIRLDPTETSPRVEDRRGERRGDITIPPGDPSAQGGFPRLPPHEADGRVIVGCWDGRQMLEPSVCDGGGRDPHTVGSASPAERESWGSTVLHDHGRITGGIRPTDYLHWRR